MSKHPLTAAQFFAAIPGSGGIITTIAHRVGCAWITARKFIDEHPTVRKAYDDELESIADMAEGTLLKSIKDGNTQDAKWYLARIRRGKFGESLAVTGKDGTPLFDMPAWIARAEQNRREMEDVTDNEP